MEISRAMFMPCNFIEGLREINKDGEGGGEGVINMYYLTSSPLSSLPSFRA